MSYGKGLTIWIVEATSAVLLVLCNKILMTGQLDFRFPTTLTAAHFAWTAVGTSILNSQGSTGASSTVEVPPWFILCGFVLLSSGAIIMSNASLMLNSVAFYQMTKLATLPFVACLEWLAQTKTFTLWHPALYATILTGVAMTVVGDITTTPLGTATAVMSVVCAGLHQFYSCRLQHQFNLSPTQLLAMVAPVKAVLLFLIGPVLDHIWFGSWIMGYNWTVQAAGLIQATCLVAICLNIAHYHVIRHLGAGTYQVLSQLKTIAIVVLGSVYFGGAIDAQAVTGAALTICAVAGLTQYERYLANSVASK